MSLAQIVLTTNKTTSNVGDYIRKIGQGERGQILPVIVVDATGTPYDLSDKKIVFSESKDSGKYVVDDGKASTSGKFTLTDPQNGKFSYALQDQVYPESGTAWFDIVSADGTVLDTTVSFRFVVIPSATLHVNDDNYSSTLDALQAHYQGVIKNTETQTQNLINSLTDKINQAISNGQRDVANELTDMRNQLQALHNQENGLIQSWTNDFNARKADFDKLKADWQAQSVMRQRLLKLTLKLNLSMIKFRLKQISNSKPTNLLVMQNWPKLNLMHRHNMIKLKKLKMMQLRRLPLKGMLRLIKQMLTLKLRLMLCKQITMRGSLPH